MSRKRDDGMFTKPILDNTTDASESVWTGNGIWPLCTMNTSHSLRGAIVTLHNDGVNIKKFKRASDKLTGSFLTATRLFLISLRVGSRSRIATTFPTPPGNFLGRNNTKKIYVHSYVYQSSAGELSEPLRASRYRTEVFEHDDSDSDGEDGSLDGDSGYAVVFHVSKGPFLEEFLQCVTYGFYTAVWQEQLYTTFSLVCMFILPLFILTMTYASTFITLQKSERIFRNERTTLGNTCPEFNRRRLLRKAKMRALRISVVIVLAFVICWTPYYISMVIYIFTDPTEHLSQELQSGIFFFGMSNSLINPIIYGAFHLCRCKNRRASFNLIIINRNGSNLQYQTSGKNITPSTTCRTSATDAITSVVNVFEDGVRYSFRRHSNRQRSINSGRRGSFVSSGGDGPSRMPMNYDRLPKGPVRQRQSPKSFLSYVPKDSMNALTKCVAEEQEEARQECEWDDWRSHEDRRSVASNGRMNSVHSWPQPSSRLLQPEVVKDPRRLGASPECPCNSYTQRQSDTML
ncbi:uncharacterized protein LOC125043048 [Penaeus chinensis]|uniref:uncharacterized protein LOC125043048 n=1 Tax=Penaeus chinensis TaxID=139456 RepID=UPI001FB7AF27|nr:uncharacterized protein LOC125043048 [Penaeus chinensis]